MSEIDPIAQEMANRIKAAMDPECIILFGSRSRGTARPQSDYDVLIIKDSSEPRYVRAAPLYKVLADLPAETNLLVYTPDEVRQWSAVPQAFITTAIREGTVLYERKI